MANLLDATERLVAWRVNYSPDIYYNITSSKDFVIGKWCWNLEVRSGFLGITMKPKDTLSTLRTAVPIATIVIRVFYPMRSPKVTQYEVTDKKLVYGYNILSNIDIGSTIVKGTPVTFSLEFLDLKMENDGKSYSIWAEQQFEQNVPLSRMLSESIYTDIVINATNGSIKAHRAVLSANSPVFQTMFSKNYKEKETSTINIMDMLIEACKAMLNFIYGKVNSKELRGQSKELILAADKYDIADLKKVCEVSLCDDVGATNVFEMLQCASTHGLQDLKSTCLLYLVKMGTIFELREEYNSFLRKADPDIIVELSNALLDVFFF